MKTVCELDRCTGCMACVDICPKGAVRIADSLRSYNAVIQEDLCVGCDLCHQVCQNNSSISFKEPIQWHQGWAKDAGVRSRSSSGGAAQAIAQGFVKAGGAVCSCVFVDGAFGFRLADTPEDAAQFTGSKYVKSNPEGMYRKIARRLKNGQKVLFIGLPCQAAAVKTYTKDHPLLYTVDLICHGTPSPGVLERFLQQNNYSLNQVKSVEFRKKDAFQLCCSGRTVTVEGSRDAYLIAFLNSLIYTENCYQCPYAQTPRVSDLSLGDSWGSQLSGTEQKKGISLILCQTEKGDRLLQDADMVLLDVDKDGAVKHNQQLQHPSQIPQARDAFFEDLIRGKSFRKLVKQAYPKQYLRQRIKAILLALGIMKK